MVGGMARNHHVMSSCVVLWHSRPVSYPDGVIGGIVDAHVNQWHPRQSSWPVSSLNRLRRGPSQLGNRLFSMTLNRAAREYILAPGMLSRPYEPKQYLADIAAVPTVAGAPVQTVVAVESQWRARAQRAEGPPATDRHLVDETRYLSSLPFGQGLAPALGAIVVGVDPRTDDFGATLDEHLEVTDRVRAVRFRTAHHPDPRVLNSVDADGVLSSAESLRGFGEAVRRGLSIETFVYSHQLYEVVTLAREYPEATIIVDHFGAPVGAFGPTGMRTGATAAARADILRLWRERMMTLSAHPNVVVKLSGLALPVLGYGHDSWGNIGSRETLTEMVGPLIEYVVAHFGAGRVMFGSNLPVDRPNASADMIVGALVDILSPWGNDMLRSVFRDTARRVYALEM